MKYTVEDKIMLVLEVNDDSRYKAELEWICNYINHIGDTAAGVMKNNNPTGEIPLDILYNIDVFITTSAYESVQCIDYLTNRDVSILSGINVVTP